ncbi:hypothetical protein C8F01DRAFT_1106753, partial [Mycena amicta]
TYALAETNLEMAEALDWDTESPEYKRVQSTGSSIPAKMNAVLRAYFRTTPTVTAAQVVDAMRDGRAVGPGTYNRIEFRQQVKSSGLADTLAMISDPAQRHEVFYPHTSNAKYNWRKYFGVLLHKWTPPEGREAGEEIYSWSNMGHKVDAVKFIEQVMAHPRFVDQLTVCPENACLLLGEDNFKVGWLHWGAATVKAITAANSHLNIPGVDAAWDLEDLWRHLCNVDIGALKIERTGVLYAVLLISYRHRNSIHAFGEHAHHPDNNQHSKPPRQGDSGRPRKKAKTEDLSYGEPEDVKLEKKPPWVCKSCGDQPDEQKCVRTVTVVKRPDAAHLKGVLFTHAIGNDVVGYRPGRRVVSPKTAGFAEYGSRPEVFQRCTRDITRFQTKDGTLRFCVQYNAFSSEVYEKLCDSHTEVGDYANKKERASATQVAGDMALLGPRLASGGAPGDGYRYYACQSASSVESATTFLNAAWVNDILLECGRNMAPGIHRQIKNKAEAAGLSKFGKTSMNAFYCWEYAAPLHPDADESWSLCCQLRKKSRPDEYNFTYAEWGVVIRTEENSMWIFNPQEIHGTVLPRASTYKGSVSRGIHTTIRHRDVVAATQLEEARRAYASRTRFWKGVI